ncbi:MAG TPA: DMT family transporter, partial [Candidatus Limnocylindrales bacterium]|nr:DMT family transporter [Candidatus Limnocylindrales bacterium]
MRASHAPSDAILIAAVTLWALNYSVVKFGISEFEPLALPVYRFGVSGLVFLVLLRLREGSIGIARRDLPLLVVAGFFGVTMSQITFVYALTYTSASDNALLG